MLTRFEVARIVGMRAMQLSEGAEPRVHVEDAVLQRDCNYVAGCELYTGVVDVCVRRGDAVHHVSELRLPPDVASMLNTRDGGRRAASGRCQASIIPPHHSVPWTPRGSS